MALLKAQGPKFLFTPKGMHFTKGAIQTLKIGASVAASTVRIPPIRDKIPGHLRQDILSQSYNLIEMIGRCSFILVLFETQRVAMEDSDELIQVFGAMYLDACRRDDELRKLCKLTFDTYSDISIEEFGTKTADKEY